MPGWDEASVDDLLADPIVRDLMTADGVDAGELRALLYGIQRTIERYATKQGGPSSFLGRLCEALQHDTKSSPAKAPGESRSIRSSKNPNSSCRPFERFKPAARVDVGRRNAMYCKELNNDATGRTRSRRAIGPRIS